MAMRPAVLLSCCQAHTVLHAVRRLEVGGRLGLLVAVDNMKNELMLLGVASLLLVAFQYDITSWCCECHQLVL
jgi:hypothetical protein